MIGNAKDARLIRDYFRAMMSFGESPQWQNNAKFGYQCNYNCGEFCCGEKVRWIAILEKKPKLPKGWKTIGNGCSRKAFLSPDGIVYKVTFDADYGLGWQGNRTEMRNIISILRMPSSDALVIPRATLFDLGKDAVMAMEFFPQMACNECHFCDECPTPQERRDFNAAARKLKIEDTHDGNIRWIPRQRRYAVIDIGISASA